MRKPIREWKPPSDDKQTELRAIEELLDAYDTDDFDKRQIARQQILDRFAELESDKKELENLWKYAKEYKFEWECACDRERELQQQLKNRDSKLLALAHEQNKLQQQLAEANKRIDELEMAAEDF